MNPSTKTRILFVDDEKMILELLQCILAPMNGEWETAFATSGQAALTLMEQQPFDIVVSDMRMPGMTGAQLLNEVMRRYPGTIRIIASGYADEQQALKCVGTTHQFMAKPFNLEALKATLTRIKGLKTRLPNAEIQKLLARRDRLPSIPAVYHQILEALQAPECPTQRIGEIVASDPALTAKILQLVNSAFFGFAREISSAEEAAIFLGVGTIRALTLSVHAFSAFEPVEGEGWSVDEIWGHSIRVGRLARKLAEVEEASEELREQAFTAGLLHDVGKLLLADNLSTSYLALYSRALEEGRQLADVERETFGVTHAEVGAYLLGLWGLPTPLVEAVAFHHEPGKTIAPLFGSLTTVHVANAFEAAKADAKRLNSLLDMEYLQTLALRDRVDTWWERLSAL